MGADLGLLQDLLEIADDPHASVNDFFARLQSAPGLAAEVVRVGNSPLYDMPGTIVRLERAVLILGLQATTAIVASLLVREDPLWRRRLEMALAARTLADALGLGDGHRAFLAGLLGELELPRPADATLDTLVRGARALVEPWSSAPADLRCLADLGLDESDREELRGQLAERMKQAVQILGAVD